MSDGGYLWIKPTPSNGDYSEETMIRIRTHSSADAAINYYLGEDRSRQADYYMSSLEQQGHWFGGLTERLSMSHAIQRDAFVALCKGRDPNTGEALTGSTRSGRRPGFDISFHVPKSLSILHAFRGDDRIEQAVRDAVREAMTMFELATETRVRSQGQDHNRSTGSLLYGEFVHHTSRPVMDAASGELMTPDMHLHVHAFVPNITWDPQEQKYKAVQNAGWYRVAPLVEAAFHHHLACRVAEIGYGIERRGNTWEIASIPRETLDRFSKRTSEIEAIARELNITDDSLKDELGARTRHGKGSERPWGELRREWQELATPGDLSAINGADVDPTRPDVTPAQAVDHALDLLFERSSVVRERDILRAAMQRGIGSELISLSNIKAELATRDLLHTPDLYDGRFLTPRHVVAEEQRLVDLAADGRARFEPMGSPDRSVGEIEPGISFNQGQHDAIRHVWESQDLITVVRGAAGTGKTALMNETIQGLEANGRPTTVLAPTSLVVEEVLQGEGFGDAATIASFLVNPRQQDQARGGVIWVDEAGLVGTPTMLKLMETAASLDARIVLSGDTMQHSSVERGQPMRTLIEHAHLPAAEVREVVRQRSSPAYKEICEMVDTEDPHKLDQAFQRMQEDRGDGRSWIVEHEQEERHQALARDYAELVKEGFFKGKHELRALAIAPTHKEGRQVTEAIREELKDQKLISHQDHTFTTYQSTGWETAQKADPAQYREGQAVYFNRAVSGIRAGSGWWRVDEVTPDQVLIKHTQSGRSEPLPTDKADRFAVYEPRETAIAQGDLVRITSKTKSVEGKNLARNVITQCVGFTKEGHIRLANDATLDRDNGNFQPGYVTTSEVGQGRNAGEALVSIDTKSSEWMSQPHLYVPFTRGKQGARVYTDSIETLRSVVSATSKEMSPLDVANQPQQITRLERAREARRQEMGRIRREIRDRQRKERISQLKSTGERGRTKVSYHEREGYDRSR